MLWVVKLLFSFGFNLCLFEHCCNKLPLLFVPVTVLQEKWLQNRWGNNLLYLTYTLFVCTSLISKLNSVLYLLCGNSPIILSPSSLHTPMAILSVPFTAPVLPENECYSSAFLPVSQMTLHKSHWSFSFFCQDTDFPIFLSQVTGFWASPSLKSLHWNTLSQRQDGHPFFSLCLPALLVACNWSLKKCLSWMWRSTWKVSICSYSFLKIYFSSMKCHLRTPLLLPWVFCVGGISLWGYNVPCFSLEMWKNLCVHSAQLSYYPLHWWSKERREPAMRSFLMFIFSSFVAGLKW